MSDIKKAMAAVNDMNQQHGVMLGGNKKYTEVAKRLEVFRTHFGLEYGLESDVLVDDGARVVIKATIRNAAGAVVATGFAEEIRGSSKVNKTSAIENCESSAWGRALANIGLHGGQIASIDEVKKAERNEQAINENQSQNNQEQQQPDINQQWVDWAKQSEAHVANLKSEPALRAWSGENNANLTVLQGVDQALHAALEQTWTAQMEIVKDGQAAI